MSQLADALRFAVHDRDLVAGFLKQGADPNAGSPYDTALSRAALGGSQEVIKLLLSHGGDVNRGDVLHWAVERKTETREIVSLLLRHGAQPDRLRFDGIEPAWSVFGFRGLGTPLHSAVTSDKPAVVFELLKHGADPHFNKTLRKTPRELAEDFGNDKLLHMMIGEMDD